METAELESQQTVAGRYRVLSLLGRGGMGAVYHVVDQRDGRELALKRLLVTPGHERTAAELFEREYHTLSELAHPRIIEVYDYGVDSEGAYYTMELLHGQDLRELGKTDWRTACGLLRDVASSLAILHSRKLLHCDVSPRNVRCTLDGRAKLLDFGAMAPMGVSKRVVGTAAFIAPEMVQLQTLDGRTDLYGLGALGYWLLTGKYAYPARTLADLRYVWHTPPRPAIELEPSLPLALSELLMDCLRLNRNARPRSAGEVMERLCAIASLSFDEQMDVAQAYLTMPTLVGRDRQLTSVRRLLSTGGHGGVLAVRGPAGSGRSRLLDACVLEAKLLGWQALRTDAGDAALGSYGVARALCEQLFALAPEAARSAARLHAPVLAHVLGAELVQSEPTGEPPPRKHVLSALRDFVLSVARSLRLFIAVDDADRIDEASASLLVALGHKAQRRPLCLVFAMDSQGDGSAALDMLLQTAEHIDLPPLSEHETEQLVNSVFGAANNTLSLARRLHATSRGNPLVVMQLVQHLVEQGIARYEAGSFVLPERLREEDLPRSLAAALERRMSSLEADALELARVLALTEPSELAASSYVALTHHADLPRTYHALDQLVRAQILEVEGDRYRLSHTTWREVLCGGLEPRTRIELHARLARVFEPAGTVARRAHHLMESAQPEAAIRVLLAQYLKDPNEPRDPLEDYVPGMLDLLERAAASAEALRLPAPLRVELRMKMAGASQFVGDLPRFLRVGPPLLAQLKQESGLCDYEAEDASMEPMARLTAALTRTQQRYDATPEAERGLHPVDAIRELARLCAMFAGMATVAQEIDLFECLPCLSPLAPLSPAISAIQQFVDATRGLVQGRTTPSLEQLRTLLKRLSQPDRAGLGELYQKSMRLGALYMLGLSEASGGVPDAAKQVAELEREPGHRVNAQRVHLTCHLMQGNLEAAAAAQRRAELVMLQDRQQERYPGSTARMELFLHAMIDDLAGVKQVNERLVKAALTFPQWTACMHLGRCHYRRLQGDLAGALEALQPALELAQPTRNRDWTLIVAAHVQVLTALGRVEEAVERGVGYLGICEQEQLHPGSRWVAHATAEALIAAGRPAEAVTLANGLIADVIESGGRGLALGAPYELRARAAIIQSDEPAFIQFAALCEAEYRRDRNSVLAAKYERLLREAERTGLLRSRASLHPESQAPDVAASTAISSAMRSRLLECPDASMRARCALAILAESVDATQSYLYGMREGRAMFLCALPEAPPPQDLDTAIDGYLIHELESEGQTVVATAESTPTPPAGPKTGGAPTESDAAQASIAVQGTVLLESARGDLYPLLLSSKRDGQAVIVAVAALHFRSNLRKMPPASVLQALAGVLLECDDVDAASCLG